MVKAESTPMAGSERMGVWARGLRALHGELSPFHFRFSVAQASVAPLPWLAFSRLRTQLYRRLGGLQIGPRSLVLGRIELVGMEDALARFSIGTDCIINGALFADLTGEIRIGNGVSIGHHVTLITAGHQIDLPERRGGALKPEPIVIEDGCLLGACVTVMPGVTIGAGAVVAAGSLVTANVAANKLVGGVPARVVKSLLEKP